MGTESDWLSLGQPTASCGQRAAGLASAGAFERTGGMAGRRSLRPASSASGIGGLDYGAQECAHGVFLSADAPCMACIC